MLIIRQRIAVLALATVALLLAACEATAVPTAEVQDITPVPTAPPPVVPRVSLEEAKSAYDAGLAIFVDVRPPESYKTGHISGAINIPAEEIEARVSELDKQEWIITYCT